MKEIIEKIIRGGGDILLRHFGKTKDGRDKNFKGDTESDADRETEAYLVAHIAKAFPEDAIMTEEHPEYTAPKNGRLWIIDALDGSWNFISGVPFFGISIALVHKNRVQCGMVYMPCEQEIFWASRGNGAFRNDKRIHVSRAQRLENIRIAFVPHHHRYKEQQALHISQQLMLHKIWQFNTGNLIIPLCYAACGRFEGTITLGVSVWDVAGSNIIVEEAGGTVTDLEGKPWDWRADPQNIVAANSVLHKKIMRDIIA